MLNKFQEISTFTELLIITGKCVSVQNCSVYIVSIYVRGGGGRGLISILKIGQLFKHLLNFLV